MALDTVLAALFRTTCLLCEEPAWPVRFCRQGHALTSLPDTLCQWCGEPLSQELVGCGRCEGGRKLSVPTRSLFILTDEGKQLIHRIKYESFPELISLLSPAFKIWQPWADMSDTVLIPVPLHREKLWKRGLNTTERFAANLSKSWRVPVSRGLRRVAEGSAQAGLSRRDRLKNLKGAFAWAGEPVPCRVVLVDDVYTTGATLESCAAPLRKSGVKEVRAVTVFRTPLNF